MAFPFVITNASGASETKHTKW